MSNGWFKIHELSKEFLNIFHRKASLKLRKFPSWPILCYHCVGVENNSTCSDPFDEKTNTAATKEECIHGVCVKWTRYINGIRMMERTCSARMDLNIMKIDGVCRTESDGNGYLCMCGKHLCNGTPSLNLSLLSAALCALVSFHQWLPWFR
ncbi:protein quiver-like [Mizuhopecten yessoensis]|uniref:protein quiver-like n=1 Tax=Mizuhopecten yessoensis TaxID=6573 RepID=UPI000B459761|nr:protein quiver-like [Mizuhopecten yessoensis]